MAMPEMLQQMIALFAGVGIVLVAASAVGFVLKASVARGQPHGGIDNLNARIRAWWVMVAVSACAFMLGRAGVTLLFLFISIVALREYLSVTCTRVPDHPALAAIQLLVPTLQYLLVYLGWYGAYAILVPACAFILLPIVVTVFGNASGVAVRAGRLQWGLMICVYCISHVPALLTLDIPGYAGRDLMLIVFLMLVVQSCDVLQYIWGKLCGRRKVAPRVSPSKTWEGLVGGIATATILAAAIHSITPFTGWQAALMGLAITTTGFAGGLLMSAIKRQCGVKDWGRMIEGHGGVLDRLDSVIFAAPAFFYLTRVGWM
jgi:phosphatidate cytidylyltransferase